MSVNKAILVGRLGADPETKTTAGGVVIGNLRIATDERRKTKDGEWTKHTEWHRVTVFGKTAENAAKFLKKGSQLYVEGRIQTKKYQDKDGIEKYTTEVVADEVRYLDSNPDGGGRSAGEGRQANDDSVPF